MCNLNFLRKIFNDFLEPSNGSSNEGLFKLFFFAFLASGSVFLLALIFALSGIKAGEFGDFIGGTLNPVLTFLTFMGLLITIVLQQSELKDTRIELKRSADALELQIKSLNRQNFENTFFQMLSLHNTIVNSMDVHRRNTDTLHGRDCFRHFLASYKNEYDNFAHESDEKIKIRKAHDGFWKHFQQDLAHYYRFFYNLVRFIDESDLDKIKYIRILRAQISDYELIILFYNGLTDKAEKFKGYIEKYSFFDNIPMEHIINKNHVNLYKNSAFKEGNLTH